MMTIRAGLFLLICGVGLLDGLQGAQAIIPDIQSISGPWECSDAKGIHGILIASTTYFADNSSTGTITSQGVSIQVYQTVGTESLMGYFVPGQVGVTTLEKDHLTIHFKGITTSTSNGTPNRFLPAFDLDLSFDASAKNWKGTWSLCNPTGNALLQRPHSAAGGPASPFAGDWHAVRDPQSSTQSGDLHFRQGSDGNIIGWIDLNSDFFVGDTRNQSNGGRLASLSSTESRILFRYGSSTIYEFDGSLSPDRTAIRGKWKLIEQTFGIVGVGEPLITLPQDFRRADGLQ